MTNVLTLGAAFAGIVAVIYLAVVGSRSIPEWLELRRHGASQSPALAPSRQVAHNVPQAISSQFIGREEEKQKILSLLRRDSRHFAISIEGLPGIGKTALAQAIAFHCLDAHPDPPDTPGARETFDAIVWASAKKTFLTPDGITTRERTHLTLDDLFTTISIVLKRDEITRTRTVDQRELVRSVLTEKRTLLIIDSNETVDDPAVIDFLLDLPTPTKVIVTSRMPVSSFYSIRLLPMSVSEAEDMIRAECLERDLVLNESVVQTLRQAAKGVPIAVVWSIAQMSFGFTPDAVLRRLSCLRRDDDLVRFCFEGILAIIRGKMEYRLLLATSLFETSARTDGVRSIAGASSDAADTEAAIVALSRLSLLRLSNNGTHLSSLGLTRSFALAELETTEEATGFKQRFVEFYERLAANVDSLSTDDFVRELDNLRIAASLSLDLQLTNSAINITVNISRRLYVHGLYTFAMECWDRLRAIPRSRIEPAQRARMGTTFANGVMYAYLKNDRGQEAFDFLKDSLPQLEQDRDRLAVSMITQRLGIISRELKMGGDYLQARQYLERARDEALQAQGANEETSTAVNRLVADALNGLGAVAILQGDLTFATACLKEADERFRRLHDNSTRSSVLRHLAEIARLRSDLRGARELCSEALALARAVGRKDRLADACKELAVIDSAANRTAEALTSAIESHDLYLAIGAQVSATKAALMVSQLEKQIATSGRLRSILPFLPRQLRLGRRNSAHDRATSAAATPGLDSRREGNSDRPRER